MTGQCNCGCNQPLPPRKPGPGRNRLYLPGHKPNNKKTPPKPPREKQPCGTRAGYTRHRARNEQPCEACVEANRQRSRERHAAGLGGGGKRYTCPGCGKTVYTGGSNPSPAPMCRPCRTKHQNDTRARKYSPQPCANLKCQKTFTPRRPGHNYCSLHCSFIGRYGECNIGLSDTLRWKLKNQKRRADNILRDPKPYTTKEVGNRDNWKCWLCHRPINPKLSGLNPQGPTIDHIIPLTTSQDDRRTNVHIAHRACNQAKGRRQIPAQMMLFG